MRRVGLLGGAFDPPHLGHLRLAEIALRDLALDEVRFVPAALSPGKDRPAADGPRRLDLLRRALEGCGLPFTVDGLELEREGPSWTVDTLEAMAARSPREALVLLMGADQAQAFPAWREPSRILALAALGVAPRPGWPDTLPPMLEARVVDHWSGSPGEIQRLRGTDLPLASRDLRAGLAAGQTPEGLPGNIVAVLSRGNLYR